MKISCIGLTTIINNHHCKHPKLKMTQEELGAVLGMSARSLARVLREAGIPARSYTLQAPQAVESQQAKPHPHAMLMASWEKGQQWQYKNNNGLWVDSSFTPLWVANREYRLKPALLFEVGPDCLITMLQPYINQLSVSELTTVMRNRSKARIEWRKAAVNAS